MNKTLTRLFTLMLLMMVSMGARAEVKVLFGEKGTEKYEGKGGTIQVKQEESRDGGKVTVRLAFIPDKNYTFDEQSLEVYKVFSPESAATRALEIDGDALKLEEDKSTNPSEKHYHVDIESKLALRVKVAQFINMRKSGDETELETELGTFFIANGNGYSSSNVANNFYLVPATNSNYATDQPHLTTSKTGQVLNSCWKVVQVTVGEKEYYRFIHVVDGKYLTANPAYSGTNGNDVGRLRVHLETMVTPDDNTLFERKANNNGGFNIRHKDMTGKINNSTTTYLDPAGGNIEGTNLTSARTATTSAGKMNVGGGIGYWTDEPAARWRFEEVPQNNTYTYNIVDCSGRIAIKYTTGADQPAAKALSSYTDIPEAIRSPYLNGETVKFYTFSGAFNADNLTEENKITATPVADNANIYVTYTTDHLSEKFLRLRGARAFNIDDGGCIYDNGGSLGTGGGTPTVTTTTHLWYISGNDPYAVQIKNLSTGKYLVSSGLPTLSLAATATNNFILMEESAAANAAYESMSLMVATGTGTADYTKKAVSAYPVSSSVTYHLIDKAGELIVSVPSTSSELALPGEWVSPLVSEYQYYKNATLSGTAIGSSCDFTSATTITSPFDVGSGGHIYVKYTVGSAVDLTGTNNYLLKFSGGESFHQEDGHDGINKEGHTSYGVTTATKAIYPYNNGDFNLYVYGQEQWESQLASGASTRTRWLWKLVSRHDGTNLTGDAVDPYHVVVKSYQNHTVKDKDLEDTTKDKNYGETGFCSSYLQTYKPSDYSEVITNIAYENVAYCDAYPSKMMVNGQPSSMVNGQPTEYMILGTSLQNMSLKTFNEVEGERRVVDSFEQYWKNNPTVENLAGTSPAANNATLAEMGWHQFTSWAYSAPWDSSTKTLAEGKHWYQTISMGSVFTVEEVSLAPQVILLDQHGWEIMRTPLTDVTTLRKYDSPMVEQYHWYPTADKVSGYHKYRVSDPKIKIYKYAQKPNSTSYDWIESGTYYEVPELDENDEKKYLYTSTTLADSPYGHITTPACEKPDCTDPSHSSQPDKVKTDFYVTYTVKDAYARNYQGAATEEAVVPSSYLLKQGGNYATFSGSGTAIGTVATKPSRESVTDNILWNLKPNFKIDEEMGFEYGTGDASKSSIESAYYAAGQNGFDPYNVQIQNKKYQQRYFTANTTGSDLNGGVWAGTSSTMSLQNMGTKQTATGYDQTTLNITNATFMVVSDGNGNMRLMPRFDNSKMMQSFGTLAAPAAAASAGDQGTGTQTLYIELVADAKEIHSSDEITDLNGNYLLASDFSFASGFTSLGTSTAPFTGTIDGQMNTFEGLTVPLVAYANGAIIRNIIIKGATISSGNTEGDAGAICCKADGATRIYNCGILPTKVERDPENKNKITGFSGSSVSGPSSSPRYVGGIVGFLDGTSRVINCYSYANITGGSVRAGIVGYNNYASKYNDLKTMVMNCMFYGDIDVVDDLYPIYGGNEISNDYNSNTANRLNNYNYFLYEAPYSVGRHISGSHYNCALAAEERFLVRFEFYRHLLNSTRELASWYATGSTSDAHSTMAKWVLDKSIAPYPILKVQGKYPSVVNYDTEYTNDATGAKVSRTSVTKRNQGKDLGTTLTITIRNRTSGGQSAPSGANVETTSLTLPRIDKDTLNYNFNYDKVQLPYYNDVGTGNYTDNRVVTGWKIVSMEGGTAGGYSETNYDAPNYNYADRDTYGKDIYPANTTNKTSGRIFSQGGYFNVPKGVTGITIEPYWGIAAYLSDACYDRYGYNNTDDLTQVGGGQRYTNDTNCPVLTGNQKVYTTASSAISALTGASGTATVYDYALVLVGNYHHHATTGKDGPELSSGTKPFTIMSIDLNEDNEPDYCLIYRSGKNKEISPIRFDFITVPGMVMAHKMASHSDLGIPGNCCPTGWFEITTTGLIKYGQFEHSYGSKTVSPLIFMGGIIDQFVTNNTSDKYSDGAKTTYMLFGDNVWFKLLSNGSHMDKKRATPHRPISMVGGEYEKVYLSGYFLQNDSKCTEGGGDRNAEGYIDGGRFGEVAGASQEIIDGDVTWMIDHADIHSFFGGGINEGRAITGDIKTTIKNSRVDEFYGGPKFGNMAEGKSVTTNATGCIFGVYYGAGYGGTAISQVNLVGQQYQSLNYDWKGWVNGRYESSGNANYRGKLNTGNKGISIDYECEFFAGSSGNVARLYGWFAAFSTAQTNDVNSKLEKCIVLNNFYGGGALGRVTGTATSELNNCIVYGNVFGAGYSASIPTVTVRNAGGLTEEPKYNTSTGVYEEAVYPGTTEYTWEHVNSLSNGNQALDGDHHIIKTTKDITALGRVATVELTIKGNSVIGTDGDITGEKGNVFGGGESSAVDRNTTVNIEGNTQVLGNVFGGGDEGEVQGSATVNIRETPATP